MEQLSTYFDPLHSPGARQVLVVDDDAFSLLAAVQVLESAGFSVAQATNATEALSIISVAAPDLIVLDVTMPDIDGFTFCHQLKTDAKFQFIPILFMTARDSLEDLVKGFTAGGQDYVSKPFRREELLARVTTHIRLHDALIALDRLLVQSLDANALTHLPGNATIESTIQNAIENRMENMVIYVDLDNFKAFNDRYGFSRGDRLLRFTADILCHSITSVNGGFVGNVGGDDFVIVVPNNDAHTVAQAVIAAFDAGVSSFYDPADQECGGIRMPDRREIMTFYPLASISLAGVLLRNGRFSRVAEVSEICAELKKMAKKTKGSCFVYDRRES